MAWKATGSPTVRKQRFGPAMSCRRSSLATVVVAWPSVTPLRVLSVSMRGPLQKSISMPGSSISVTTASSIMSGVMRSMESPSHCGHSMSTRRSDSTASASWNPSTGRPSAQECQTSRA